MATTEFLRETLKKHGIFLSNSEAEKLLFLALQDFHKTQQTCGTVACDIFDKLLKHSAEKLHCSLHLTIFACDHFMKNQTVVFGDEANAALNLKFETLKKLIDEIFQFLTPSIVFSNVFSQLMHDKEQAAKEKPQNLAG
jgi:hypothetical protein